jgi:hypothetical protein
MRRWLVWIPILMIASLVYWTVALGLGGLSLMAVSTLSGSEAALGLAFPQAASVTGEEVDGAELTPPQDGFEPIVVRLEESVEPEDVDDNLGFAAGASMTAANRCDGADLDGDSLRDDTVRSADDPGI